MQAKEGRIRELRAALSSAMESNSAAEGQTGVMLAEKQQVGVRTCKLQGRLGAGLPSSKTVLVLEVSEVMGVNTWSGPWDDGLINRVTELSPVAFVQLDC